MLKRDWGVWDLEIGVAWAWKGVGCRSYVVPRQGLVPGTQARGKAEKRKVMDEVARVEPTTHCWRGCGSPHARPSGGGTRISNLLQELCDPAKGKKRPLRAR